jgi:hypothetical protein
MAVKTFTKLYSLVQNMTLLLLYFIFSIWLMRSMSLTKKKHLQENEMLYFIAFASHYSVFSSVKYFKSNF